MCVYCLCALVTVCVGYWLRVEVVVVYKYRLWSPDSLAEPIVGEWGDKFQIFEAHQTLTRFIQTPY
jgi:hypothetical protein